MTMAFNWLKWYILPLLCMQFYLPISKGQVKEVHLSGRAQGTTWKAIYYAQHAVVGKHEVDSLLQAIDSALSLYKPYSSIVAFNKSGRGIKIGPHFKNVIARSFDIYRETGQLSDITVAPLVNAWGFGADGNPSIPDEKKLKAILPCVGSDKIILRNDSLIKLNPCVQIDLNGIAQGYSVDVIASFLESKGIRNYLVELGGELRVKGTKQPDVKPFRIGIEAPIANEFVADSMQRIVTLKDGAITTSGSYRKFHESGGKRYSHIIHPKTGKPVSNELISVTVFANDAITADAFDNALMLMGLEKALQFVEARKNLAAFFIYKTKQGAVKDTASSRFELLFRRPANVKTQ